MSNQDDEDAMHEYQLLIDEAEAERSRTPSRFQQSPGPSRRETSPNRPGEDVSGEEYGLWSEDVVIHINKDEGEGNSDVESPARRHSLDKQDGKAQTVASSSRFNLISRGLARTSDPGTLPTITRGPVLAPQRRRVEPQVASHERGGGSTSAVKPSGQANQAGSGQPRRIPSSRMLGKALPVGTAATVAATTANRRKMQRALSPHTGDLRSRQSRDIRTGRPAVILPQSTSVDDTRLEPMIDRQKGMHDLELDSYFAGGLDAYSPRCSDHLEKHMSLKPIEESSPIVIRGRVGVYCNAEKYDHNNLENALRKLQTNSKDNIPRLGGNVITNLDSVEWQDDALHVRCQSAAESSISEKMTVRDIFFFEWGLVVFWGFDVKEEHLICDWLSRSGDIVLGKFDEDAVEVDEYNVVFTAHDKPKIENDTITMALAMLRNSRVKLAVSYAIAQSTKLSIFEERIQLHTEAAVELPKMLATTGKISTSRVEISKLIGQVVLEKCAMNLLSTVMDTPEFFWNEPDSLQALYDAVCEYLEVEVRITVLNARFDVLNQMLDMLRDHQNNEHSSHLEWIVIILIVIEVIIGCVEIAGLMGVFKGKESGSDLGCSTPPPLLIPPHPPM